MNISNCSDINWNAIAAIASAIGSFLAFLTIIWSVYTNSDRYKNKTKFSSFKERVEREIYGDILDQVNNSKLIRYSSVPDLIDSISKNRNCNTDYGVRVYQYPVIDIPSLQKEVEFFHYLKDNNIICAFEVTQLDNALIPTLNYRLYPSQKTWNLIKERYLKKDK